MKLMRARILEINEYTIILKDEKKRFYTIDKKRLDFDYALGDTVNIDRQGGKLKFRIYGGNEPLTGEGYETHEAVRRITDAGSKTRKGHREQLGGWLAIFTVMIAVSILYHLAIIPTARSGLSVETCMDFNANFNNACADVDFAMKVEYIVPLLLTIFDVFLLSRIIMRRKNAKILAIIRCIAWPVHFLLRWVVYSFINIIHLLPDDFYTDIQLSSIFSIVGLSALAAAWILYFHRSERVEYTLTK